MIDDVEALVREVAATAVMPRFRRLAAGDIIEKGPGDLVTAADHEAEALLTKGLIQLLPGSLVVGEEAVAADASVLSVIHEPGSVWLVDPVDGTANFASGNEPFAIMVALLRAGMTVAGWILDPVSGVAAVAEHGSGARLGGHSTAAVPPDDAARPADQLRGPSFGRYMPATVRDRLAKVIDAELGGLVPGRNCAGYEYPALVRDEHQFAVFWRTLPWDHAAGVLFVEESGGVAQRPDATPYSPVDGKKGLVVARSHDVWDTVRPVLLPACQR